MNLKEFQAKRIFDEYDIPIPRSVIYRMSDEKVDLDFIQSDDCLVKAQILTGKRGKNGGILACQKDDCTKKAQTLFGKRINGFKVKEVLIEEKVIAKHEYYVGLTLDRFSRQYVLIISKEGGVDIEELSHDNPKKIIKILFTSYDMAHLSVQLKEFPEDILPIIQKMYNIMKDRDATLVEINPLIETKDDFIAADAKIVIDDNALYRHKHLNEFKYQGLSAIEKVAQSSGLHYVDLDGNIGVIGNGAGLVMATIDLIHEFGGKPANFLDLKGGTGVETMEVALETLSRKSLKGICINIFAGITHCDDIAQGILNFKQQSDAKIPIVVRMIGTNEDKGKKILESARIKAFENMEDAIKEIVRLTK